MQKPKLIRITTIPLSLEKLLEGQLQFMNQYYEVVAVSSEKARLEAFAQHEGVRFFYLPLTRKITPFRDLLAVWCLYRFLKKERPLIVHTHTPKAGIVGMLAAFLARVPHRFHTVAGLPLMEAKGLKRSVLNLVEKCTYRFATRVYPNSKGLFDFIVTEGFAQEKKLKVIGNGSSNGIDTRYFSRSHFSEEEIRTQREKLKIPSWDFTFVFVGRIVRDKGIDELVAAFIKLQERNQNCSLLLVGPFENDLDPISEESFKNITAHKKIITTGFQPDVRSYLALSDALVFPSYREGFPNVVLQAGAMELPGLVSDINGCNEIIEHGSNGLIYPVKDEAALFATMEDVLTNRDLQSRLKKRSREMITSRFERSEIWNALLKEYPKT
jgi:glycosyltransferase involved in cell wall biosynthesis